MSLEDELAGEAPEVLDELSRLVVRRRAEELFRRRVSGEDEPRARLRLETALEVAERPGATWLVNGLVTERATFQVFGQTGEYKSFLMLDMALSIANDVPFLGREIGAPGPVAIVLGEGGADIGQRVSAWMAGNPGRTDKHALFSVEQGLDLMDESDVDAIIEELEAHRVEAFPYSQWKMLLFDTQADHMPNGDEDRSKDFTVVKRSIQRIAHATGAAVGLVHHTGWNTERERGSSRQRQALDVVMHVDRGKLKNVKQKFGPKFDPIPFETVEAAGSLYTRLRVGATGLLGPLLNQVDDDMRTGVRALRLLVDQPRLSQNQLIAAMEMRKSDWPPIRDLLEASGLVTLSRRQDGTVTGVQVTDQGLAYATLNSA